MRSHLRIIRCMFEVSSLQRFFFRRIHGAVSLKFCMGFAAVINQRMWCNLGTMDFVLLFASPANYKSIGTQPFAYI
ncbi:hypothetical protein HanRHA438_Chr13g0608181 [Helianthus annuus]|uniref:Uncharacterized protein n=1 Tax=Helianthus annuus TaxID=4232 RepID=A0A251STK6_HELAN|nr:hypothetical protein HanXRQr2_Chr13g0597621 [Helianthus annuus]KAJ0477594.1 hypothetical protein HanHA300_Chr13g0490341 [Helianthus annuus]KAJ0482101.1 hypothetical protein HanIR_Chr13g0650131 [Helianthus annuus]KAJ0498426.1 hypothetical protein HanHA89_Chr13g0522481 [Helianthus annuus]KAJ0664438.1 hypothetical protein HanLR1_Chr13g0492431 [Helianthus annuus]